MPSMQLIEIKGDEVRPDIDCGTLRPAAMAPGQFVPALDSEFPAFLFFLYMKLSQGCCPV